MEENDRFPPKTSSHQQILDERRSIRREERRARRLYRAIQSTGDDVMGLRQRLIDALPANLLPGNVGSYTGVQWPFWYNVDFDLGALPVLDKNTRQVQSFQVSQEAGFLLMSISRKTFTYDLGNELAPLQFEIRDRQSSRVLNDKPMPMQMIGKKSRPTVLPTPFLIMPNDFIDVTLSCWLTTTSQTGTGSGKIQLSLFGYRVRIEDNDKVLNSVFG